MTFCELREKDVINIRDCRRLGHVCDLELDPKNGCILALTASSGEKLWGVFGKDSECAIPIILSKPVSRKTQSRICESALLESHGQ